MNSNYTTDFNDDNQGKVSLGMVMNKANEIIDTYPKNDGSTSLQRSHTATIQAFKFFNIHCDLTEGIY